MTSPIEFDNDNEPVYEGVSILSQLRALANSPEVQTRRAAQAEHDRLDQLAGVIHAHVASNVNGLPAEHYGYQTLFYSKWAMGRVCVVRDINTRRLMIAREYTRTVETFDMGELSSVRTETAYIGA